MNDQTRSDTTTPATATAPASDLHRYKLPAETRAELDHLAALTLWREVLDLDRHLRTKPAEPEATLCGAWNDTHECHLPADQQRPGNRCVEAPATDHAVSTGGDRR